MTSLSSINQYIFKIFDMNIKDKSLNGIQIENNGNIEHIFSAVDFSIELLEKICLKNSLFIVHHGIFWGHPFPIVDRYYKMIHHLIKKNQALIAIHLPLDIHPTKGNNILLAHHLKMKSIKTFGDNKDIDLLLKGDIDSIDYDLFIENLSQDFSILKDFQHGNKKIKNIGLCTGGGLFGIEEAKKNGCDTFITGDTHHIYYHLSKEIQINLISIGHYNSEILGIKNLGNELQSVFNIPHQFVDIPTGV